MVRRIGELREKLFTKVSISSVETNKKSTEAFSWPSWYILGLTGHLALRKCDGHFPALFLCLPSRTRKTIQDASQPVASGFLKSYGKTIKRYIRKTNWVVVPRNRLRRLWMRSPWRNASDFLGLGKLFWGTTKLSLEFSQGGYTTGACDIFPLLPGLSFQISYWESYSFCRNCLWEDPHSVTDVNLWSKNNNFWYLLTWRSRKYKHSISTIQSLAYSSQISFSWDL